MTETPSQRKRKAPEDGSTPDTEKKKTKKTKKTGRPSGATKERTAMIDALGKKHGFEPTKQWRIENLNIEKEDEVESQYTHHPTARDFTEESKRRIPKSQRSANEPDPVDFSPFVETRVSFKVTVPPVASLYPLEGALAHYISPLLLTWQAQLNGILLAYNNAKLHTNVPSGSQGEMDEELPMAEAKDECAAPYVWLTLDALVFKPKKGLELEAYSTLQTESQVTLVLWNYFTVTVSQNRLPPGWEWHDEYDEDAAANYDESTYDQENGRVEGAETVQYGSWYDSNKVKVQGFLRFKIKDWDCAPPGTGGEGSFMNMQGSMLTEIQELQYEAKKLQDLQQRRAKENAVVREKRRKEEAVKSAMKEGKKKAAEEQKVMKEKTKKKRKSEGA